MATGRSDLLTKKSFSFGACIIFFLLLTNCEFVAASVTWTSPPPAWTQTDRNDINTVNKTVEIGSNQVSLRWNYTSLSSQLISTTFSIGDGSTSDDIGLRAGGITSVNDGYETRFAISRSEVATLIINKVTEKEEAVYQCKLTVVGNTWAYNIRVIVAVPAEITKTVGDQDSVQEGQNVTLFCEASGKPTPNITWTRKLEDGSSGNILHQGPTWDFPSINRTASGTYRCTVYNGFGNPVSHTVKVNVDYPAKVDKVTTLKKQVAVQQSVSLLCEAEGKPQPTYQWTPCPQQTVCNNNVLNITEVLNDGVFTCTVTNSLGSDVGNVSIFIAGNVINVTLTITNEECTDGKYNQTLLWKNLNETIDKIFANTTGYTSAQLKNVRCGILIVDLALKFNSTTRESEVIDVLRSAASNNKFGIFQVNASSITGTRPMIEKTTSASPTTPTTSSDSKTWIIVVAVLVPLFVLFVVAGVVACCMYKKRQCKKKDSRVHNNEDQEQPTNNYAEVNQGYSAAGANHNSGAANPPAGPPVYAVVDKSKRREKKPKPGELQYAELADLQSSQNMPRTSASRGSYPATDTQYADVNTM